MEGKEKGKTNKRRENEMRLRKWPTMLIFAPGKASALGLSFLAA